MRSIKVVQECERCGHNFPIIYNENGRYDYCTGDEAPCDCEEPFHCADRELSLSEWIEQIKATKSSYEYKLKQLKEMLAWEERQPKDQRYGAHLTHWSGHGEPINLDADALQLLIRHYTKLTEAE